MKQKIIQHIESLMKEHEEAGYCTNYDMAQNELNKSIDRPAFNIFNNKLVALP